VAVEPGARTSEFDASAFVAAGSREIATAAASLPPAGQYVRPAAPPAAAAEQELSLDGFAAVLHEALGLGADGARPFGGPVGTLSPGAVLPAEKVVAYVAAAAA